MLAAAEGNTLVLTRKKPVAPARGPATGRTPGIRQNDEGRQRIGKIPEPIRRFRSAGKGSIVVVDGKIILRAESGPIALVELNPKAYKEISQFAALKGAAEPGLDSMDGPKMERFMREMERDMSGLDENNPRHMAHMMRKMQDALPADMMPKEMNEAIRRLESGEDPGKIEEDMGEMFDQFMGDGSDGGPDGMGGYTKDGGLYDL